LRTSQDEGVARSKEPNGTQTATQTHDLNLWSAEPISGSEEQLVKKSTKPRLKKQTPTSQKELARLDSSDLASSLWNYKKNTAVQFNDPTEILNAIYYCYLQARRVLDSRICLNQRKRKHDQNEGTENQKTTFSAIRAFCGRKMGTANYKEGQRYSDKKHNKPT